MEWRTKGGQSQKVGLRSLRGNNSWCKSLGPDAHGVHCLVLDRVYSGVTDQTAQALLPVKRTDYVE
jgi:hypothetical protein